MRKLFISNISKIESGREAEHNLVMKSETFLIRQCLTTLKFEKLTMKMLTLYANRQNSIELQAKS